ncbi:MAG: short-chain dehydrogenase, partial [Bacteroidetes bacterium]
MKILITGASSGLGKELARQYATQDNELILLARREDKLYK